MKKGTDPAAALQKGLAYHQAGDLKEAEKIYRRVLKAQPGNPDALHLSGLVHHQLGRHRKAIGLIRRAVKAAPGNPMFLNNLGEAWRGAGKPVEAAGHYRAALKVDPGYAEAWNNLGLVLVDQGNAKEAEEAFLKAFEADPRLTEAPANLGNLLANQGKVKEAEEAFLKAIEADPPMNEALASLGSLLADQGRPAEARDRFEQALAIDPNQPEVLNDLALALKDAGDWEGARQHCLKALELDAGYADAWVNLGHVLYKLKFFVQAGKAYREALRLCPDYAKEQAFVLALGLTLGYQNKSEEAIPYLRRAFDMDPDDPIATANLFFQYQRTLNWDGTEELASRMNQQTRAILEQAKDNMEGAADKHLGETPFINISRSDDAALNLAVARHWSREEKRQAAQQAKPFVHSPKDLKKNGDKALIKLGYFSSDFRNHPIGHMLVRLFGLHERKDFKVFAYSNGADDGSIYRKTLESEADKFTDIRAMNNAQAAKQTHDDGIDILVDLTGATEGGRFPIFALRPAPVQVSWLGFPGTTGADYFDYLVTDEVITPPQLRQTISETPVYMPGCYQLNDHHPAIAATGAGRGEAGLPEDGCVFCSFNQNHKIEPVMFSAWMRILEAVPESVLWILLQGQVAKENLLREAGKRGIDPGRVVFAAKIPKDEHMERLGLADLALDTRVYGGHTTTTDALYAGTPVLALKGRHFASRVSMSLLRAAELPELVTESLTEYEATAIRLGRNPAEIGALKEKIAERRKTAPLFDGPLFVRGLEAAYRRMWRTWLRP